MADSIDHRLPSFKRVWDHLVQERLRSSTLSVCISFIAIPAATFAVDLLVQIFRRKPDISVSEVVTGALWPTIASAFITAIVWTVLLGWSFVRVVGKEKESLIETIAKKDAYIKYLTEYIASREKIKQETETEFMGQFVLATRLQKELDAARVDLINAKYQIEFLTWPADRPRISFHGWGQRQLQFMPAGNNDPALLAQCGFYLANDGGAALEITVEIFDINEDLTAIGGTIARIEGNDQGFVPVWIKDEVPLNRWALDSALERAWQDKAQPFEIYGSQPMEFPVSVVYRDYNRLWYRSRGKLIFKYNLLHANQISFSAVEQDKLGTSRPVLRE